MDESPQLSIKELAELALNDTKQFINEIVLMYNGRCNDIISVFDELSGTEKHPRVLKCGVTLTYVDGHGGHEGGGEDVERIIKVEIGIDTVYFVALHIRYKGFYDSYNGTEFDEDSVELVYPRQVTVTKYFNMKEVEDGI